MTLRPPCTHNFSATTASMHRNVISLPFSQTPNSSLVSRGVTCASNIQRLLAVSLYCLDALCVTVENHFILELKIPIPPWDHLDGTPIWPAQIVYGSDTRFRIACFKWSL